MHRWLRLFVLGLGCHVLALGCHRLDSDPGTIVGKRVPEEVLRDRAERQARAVRDLDRRVRRTTPPGRTKQILFGDLHVHTTYSFDAFQRTLPYMQGEGVHPPADACDFARYCSYLDFWSINDHAEGLLPERWQETKRSIRECNALAGDPENPDIVAFLGWEWTQMGLTPETHYGHKNVIFRDLEDDRVPARPISARNADQFLAVMDIPPRWQSYMLPLLDFQNRDRYLDFLHYTEELAAQKICPEGVDTRELPPDCHEVALTPDVLFEKLEQWGFDTIVIPHGTTWGFYTPPGSSLDKQLTRRMHDPRKQTLFEIFSGHGNSEEYRSFRAVEYDENGEPVCPEPTREYVPCCWQAGEIIRSRCEDPNSEDCERRVREARRNYLRAGAAGHRTVPGAMVDDWKDCGQCRTCFLPAFNYRPRNSAQYALAITNFEKPEEPLRFRFGFLASSDNHTARPGTGYKEYARRMMTEAIGPKNETWLRRLAGNRGKPVAESIPPEKIRVRQVLFEFFDWERQASFFMTGGLVGLHSEGRDRNSIWEALKRREVYGTTGDRILLWFDLLNHEDGPRPMGAEVEMAENPRFRVRAVGAFEQLPGCPDYSLTALGPERLELLCRGECYNPSDRRKTIERIEVVRIRPQISPDEPVERLVQDPWRVFACEPDPAGCEVEFEDPDFVRAGRETIYYVRAIEEEMMAINAGGLRCTYDAEGNCVAVDPCYGDYRTPFDDDCLAPMNPRAWSSPIYVRPPVSALAGR